MTSLSSNPEFLIGLVLGAFIVWILTRGNRKTLRDQLAEQTQKYKQLFQAKQAAKNRAQERDLSNYSDQIKFIEKVTFSSRKPIASESFRAVYAILEKSFESFEKKYRILAEVSLGSFIGTYNEPHSNYASDLAFRSLTSSPA